MKAGTGVVALAAALSVTACGGAAPDVPAPTVTPGEAQRALPEATSPPPTSQAPPTMPPDLLEPERVVDTGDVADWPGSWSPDGRFYVFFRWRAGAPCSGESVYAYDVKLDQKIQLSSLDYCTREVDPDQIWEGDSTLLFGDGPDGNRWEAITLGDEVTRAPLPEPPPMCPDRDIPLPPTLGGLEAVRARWSPDESLLAVAVAPEDEATRFENIPGNRPDLHLFQRLELAVFPAGGDSESDLHRLGTIFDLGPDSVGPEREEGCPGTHVRWSDDSELLISSMGPVVYEAASGEALLAPEGPNAGPLEPDLRWSPDDRRVADDSIVLDLPSGDRFTPPGMLPGYDRGFAGNDLFIYVNESGISAYGIASQSTRQLTDFQKAIFVVAPDGKHLAYAEDGHLWLIRLDF